MKNPKNFCIKGDSLYIMQAMYKELEKIGYKFTDCSSYNFDAGDGKLEIIINNQCPITFEKYSELTNYASSVEYNKDLDYVTFNLPKDYEAALAYCKEALNPSNWEEPYITGDVVYIISGGSGYSCIRPSFFAKVMSKDLVKSLGDLDYTGTIKHNCKLLVMSNSPKDNCKYFTLGDNYVVRKATKDEENTFYEELFAVNDVVVIDNLYCLEQTIRGTIGHIGRITNKDIKWHTLTPHCVGGSWLASNLRFALHNEKIIEVKSLSFGDVVFNCSKGKAETFYGTVTVEEVKTAIDYIKNPPTLAGYSLSIYLIKEECHHSLQALTGSKVVSLGFGCQKGTLEELEAIYNAMQ